MNAVSSLMLALSVPFVPLSLIVERRGKVSSEFSAPGAE